jgi:acyl-CoA synthetase (AMP-forming)/AMP-acid ligase II
MAEKSTYYHPDLTLPDLLHRTANSPEDIYIGFLNEHGVIKKLTYKQLLEKSSLIASGLFQMGLKQGDKIIIATRYNQETVEILWGCFLLGLIPTVLQAPVTFSGYNPSLSKLIDVFEQLKQPYVFLSQEVKDTGQIPGEKILHRDQLICSGEFPVPMLHPDDVAFIQFSSGSTGDPKGIMLSHTNLMVNLDAIRIGLDLHYPDKVGNWMPLFHDMGLIGYHLTPMYGLTVQYHVETIDFIMNPGLWLDLMGYYEIAISGGTNFALALVLRYLKRHTSTAGWNFSMMKALLDGAEPISVKVMQEFIEKLKPYGLRAEAIMPVYGMAEATLAITFSPLLKQPVLTAFDSYQLDHENRARPLDASDSKSRLLAGVGVPVNDIEILIEDEDDHQVPDGIPGQILVRGPGVTKGYFNKPGITANTFLGEWLKTGDVGFFFDGSLYISGRRKDIIFRNGMHYFANDLETIACELDEINYGKVCFGATTNEETGVDKVIAFVASIPDQHAKETFNHLKTLLRSKLGITVDEMVLIKSNEIPKTSSGKLQRYRLMFRYNNHDFDSRQIITNS